MPAALRKVLAAHCDPKAVAWLDDTLTALESDFVQRKFYFAFSGACRRFDKTIPLDLTAAGRKAILAEIPAAEDTSLLSSRARWPADHFARAALLLALAQRTHDEFLGTLTALLGAADIRESVVLYSSFALLPCPEELVSLAREGTRTNIVDVFDAIALENPFPAAHFPQDGWNQMVLKALFMSRPLYRIRALEDRANQTLAEAVSNYAHERWAAGRPVSPELWRSCARFVDDRIAEDLHRVAATDEPGQMQAVALIYSHDNNAEKLAKVRPAVEPFLKDVESGELTWETLGRSLEND